MVAFLARTRFFSETPAPIRFWQRVDCTGKCWVWLGAKTGSGYGAFNVIHNKAMSAHRFAYQTAIGPIGDNMVLHKCDNRACVNPEHLFLGKAKDNLEDASRKGRLNGSRPTTQGEKHFRAKLSPTQVREIRAKYKPYRYTFPMLAKEYNVHPTTILALVHQKSYRNVN